RGRGESDHGRAHDRCERGREYVNGRQNAWCRRISDWVVFITQELASPANISAILPRLMKLSVVIPVCNEAENVLPLAQEISAALAGHQPFEILFVDDGSHHKT